MTTGGPAARTSCPDHVLRKMPLQKDVTSRLTPPRKPVFDNDYKMTDEDVEAAAFIRQSCGDAEVVDVGATVLTVHNLKPNVTKRFIFDSVSPLYCNLPELFQPVSCYVNWLRLLQVIHAYAHISNVETDTTSVIYPNESRKLLETYGGITRGRSLREGKWLARIATKCVGRRMVCVFPESLIS